MDQGKTPKIVKMRYCAATDAPGHGGSAALCRDGCICFWMRVALLARQSDTSRACVCLCRILKMHGTSELASAATATSPRWKKMYNRICIPFQTDCCKQTFQHLFVTNIIRSLNPFPGWGMFPRGDWSHLSLSFSCYLIVLVQAVSCQSYLIFSHLECIATD